MKLIIDRKEWLRGEGGENSYLLRHSDHKRCCIGILGKACGIEDHIMLVETTADSTPDAAWPEWCLKSADIAEAYRVNDNPTIGDIKREHELTKIFARHDIEVEFID